ncbi:polysaccharide deacetylase family protein [Pseudoalteromonas luteoviolacea]|uniref:polysaccharide deacetylase family protein n=1 Tax=Pseudoalteromonas luteoviolacea TaxID=43657 RepID=UPI001F34F286|nr:polysaccharide deacetylase family protein [Pseudoalteromonas luteoviolacea]MCF6438395.1 polysaccharide deacetylase family protein [Pseudoalteromonas luteoviolacea]
MIRCTQVMKKLHNLILFVGLVSAQAHSATILQYHHVSEKLPPVTSVSEDTFKTHLEFLKKGNYNVIALDKFIEHLQQGKSLPVNTVAITFDDGYDNNIEAAAPLLEAYNFPYTIFVNPQLIDERQSYVMTWDELRTLSKRGAIIANHSAKHDYLHLRKEGETELQWEKRIRHDLTWSQQRINEEIGHNYPYIAYPYGEFDSALQTLVKELGLIGIGQHSGAVGPTTDFTRVPRFPSSGIYSNLKTLKVKINSIPFDIDKLTYTNSVTTERKPSFTLSFNSMDFSQGQLACFVSGIGRATLTWTTKHQVTVTTPEPLPNGRSRYNCTAPSKTHKGRFHWFSQPWVVQEK